MTKNSYVETFIRFLRLEEKRRIYSELLGRGTSITEEETEIRWQLSNDKEIQSIFDKLVVDVETTEYVSTGKPPKVRFL